MPRLPDHPRLKWSEAGLRGVVGETLNAALACDVAAAFAAVLPDGPVALCRDSRPSGPALIRAVQAGLCAAGRKVRNLGIAPVPTLQVYVKETGCAGGIDVTSSHNPVEWNALKFVGPGGFFLTREEAARLRSIYETDAYRWARWDGQGRNDPDPTAVRLHVARILRNVDVEAIRRRRFTVALDCCNGAGAVATPHLLETLGCRTVGVHMDPERLFPHDPEPRPEHLGDLRRLVRESGADVGFAQDPDADRLAIVDERGEAISEEYTMVLAADVVLAKRPGDVVANLSGSRMIDDVAERHGVRVHRTRIGEINVSVRLREIGGAVGGEGNGGVIFPPVHEGRDSLSGIALVLEGLATKGVPLSEWVASIPSYAMVKAKVPVEPAEVGPAVEAVRRALGGDGAEVNLEDGVKISWADRWVHLRGSNTEPIVRIMAEAPTEAEARALADRARAAMGR